MKLKKKIIILVIPFLVIIPIVLCSCFITGLFQGESASDDAASYESEESSTTRLTEDQYNALMENEDFLETFNAFFYQDSEVIEARVVESEENMLYVILESYDDYDTVADYYKDKKVQSIWSRDFIFQKSMDRIEEEFTDTGDEQDTSISKYTYSSKDKDRVVDILIKDLGEGRTQIMITYWSLQDSF